MTLNFKLARRIARLRVAALLAAVLGWSACDSADRLAPLLGDETLGLAGDSAGALASDTLTEAQLQANEALGEAAFVTGSTARGIAFGPNNLPTNMLGSTYTGTGKAVGPGDVLKTLAEARRTGARIIVRMSASPENWTNKNHSVNLEKWKDQIARFKKVNLQPYINDGTLLGHYLIDEPHDASNWGGKPVPYATIEAMARYSKQLWPGLTTVVRSYPDWLSKASFRWTYLDAALAQYTASKGEVNGWMKLQANYAKLEGLGLLVSMNLLDGGTKASGIRGTRSGKYAMSASQVRSWGGVLVSHPQSCAMFGWSYSGSYFGRSDIRSALAYLSSKAKSRGRTSCRDASGSNSAGAQSDSHADTDSQADKDPPSQSSGGKSSIALKVKGQVRSRRQYMTLDWTGAKGSQVDVYRSGVRLLRTENDGHYVNSRSSQGRITYTYKVCQKGSSTCSNSVSVSFK